MRMSDWSSDVCSSDLDAGALIALDRGLATVRGYVLIADRAKAALSTSSAVVAQVWRGGARQARLARFLSSDLVTEIPPDPEAGRRIRSEERRVGKKCVSTCRYRGSPDN